MNQSLMPFEAEAFAIEAAKCEAQRAAEQHEREAKLAAKILAAQAQRAIRKRQEEMDKNTRRWKREEKTRAKNDTLTAWLRRDPVRKTYSVGYRRIAKNTAG